MVSITKMYGRKPYIVLIALYSLVFVSCAKEETKPIIKKTDSVQLPNHTSWDFRVLFMDSSRVKAILTAKRARVYDSRKETLLDTNVRVVFNNKSSQQLAVLTSDSARIDDRTRNMYASGNVVVISDSTGTLLKTPNLMWDHVKQQLYTNDIVHIETPNEIIDGTGLVSDQYLKNYRIFKVSGVSMAK